MREHALNVRREGQTIVLFPTMGFFHEGHLSLINKARKMADELVVSIFVNPIQFSPNEDYDRYPRDLERDFARAEKENVDVIFTPTSNALYPEDFQTSVTLDKLSRLLCGVTRATHFAGVTTVISKLFNIVHPHIAIFGQKDYQQLLLIRQMVKDLNYDVNVVDAPTVRETDGLAMSSRNNYLTPSQRKAALSLYQSLKKAASDVKTGTRDADNIISTATEWITAHPEITIEYITVCHPDTLEEVNTISGPTLMALAATVGKTRLIDNIMLAP